MCDQALKTSDGLKYCIESLRPRILRAMQEKDENAIYQLEKQHDILIDALLLVESQRPRLLSYDDARQTDFCWLEILGPGEICVPCSLKQPHHFILALLNHCIALPIDDYGIKWRCWTNRPTDQQRKETPWKN